MTGVPLQQMADRVASLLEERFRLRGNGLSAKLAKGGHRLPRKLRAAATELAHAAEIARNPKLMRQVDMEAVSAAYDLCLRRIGKSSPWDRFGYRAYLWLVSTLAAMAVLGLLAFAVLRWRGLV